MDMMRVEAKDWIEAGRQHLWHPYTQMATAPLPLPIERAVGAHLYTSDGRKIIDAISSWWVTLHGHAHPTIATALAEQAKTMEQVIFAGCTHEPAARFAERLCSILPGDLNRVFYSDNGSTAVEVALKMCLQYWSNQGEERRTFVALEGAYHGDTFGAMSVSGRSVFTHHFETLLFNVDRLPFPEGEEKGMAMLAACKAKLQTGDIAGLIVEPLLLGAAGMQMWTSETLKRLSQLCTEYGVPLVADEVFTGFGRTGRMFAIEHAEIVPDIVCLSKGISGGFLPFAATVCRDHIYDAFLSDDRGKTLFHGHSYTGNPLGCAAALASLQVFEQEDVMLRIATIAAAHSEGLRRLESIQGLDRIRQLGTVAAYDISANMPGYLSNAAQNLASEALEQGILLRPLGNVVYILPPYAITENELHTIYDFLYDYHNRYHA